MGTLSTSSWLIATLSISGFLFFFFQYRRLSTVPGPFLASITDLWRAYQVVYGDIVGNVDRLHARYGTFVRIAPNTVSISDPAAIPTVYSMHGEFKKADSYQPLRVMSNGKVMGSVIDMQDEAGVSALKRAVGSAFATKNLLDYEPDVDYTANILVETLRRRRTVDVFSTMQQFQVDFLMKVAFSKKTDFLTSGKSTLSISGHQRLAHWTRWHSVPWLEALLYKSPLCKAYYRSSGNPPIWTAMAIEELKVRQQQQQQQSSGQMIDKDAQEPGKGVVKTDLLWKYVQGGTRHEDNVLPTEILLKLISSTISAGFDTSAFTMTTILYFLLKNPDSVKNLRDELDAAATNLSDPPRYTETHQMEYLAAVIKESMRHFWFLSTLLEREVPQGGAEVAGRWLPGGTCVAVPAEVVHFDPSIYGEDARDFRPDRWVQADSTQRILMERTMLGFGAGKRVCLGRHIAELEMKKVIPRLLLEFDLTLDDPDYVLGGSDKYTRFLEPFSITFKDRAK